MEHLASEKIDPRNPAHGYRQYLLRLTSKVANNLGFAQVEHGDSAGAMATFQQARRIHPENISALLNLLTIAQAENRPEAEGYLAEWEAFKERQVDSRVMWSLASLYGYVHNTGFLVRHGMIWAVSGKPQLAEAELRRAAGGQPVSPQVKAFLARAYLHGGDLQRSAALHRQVLDENPRDVRSLLMLAELAIGAEDLDEAESLLARAVEAGVSENQLRFRAGGDHLSAGAGRCGPGQLEGTGPAGERACAGLGPAGPADGRRPGCGDL
jgi:Tfp pilus assembly protein PilF